MKTKVTERFLKYVSFPTGSDETSDTVPSTPAQLSLGKYITDELDKIGLKDANMDEKGYVYAYLPASEGINSDDGIGFIAHMDVSPDVSCENIKASIIKYEGGDILLSDTVTTKLSEFPFLANYVGEELIVTDGSTLLGSDDKAGIAEIISACEYLINHPEIKHKAISVCFTPDEEIGRGSDHFNFSQFKAKYAYTVDGGELGEIEYENFNAASAKITINGINIHPGSAKNKMKNAALLTAEFISMLPPAETPAHTEGYEGFYHVTDISANETLASVYMIIRDHDREKFESRKNFVSKITEYLNTKYGNETFILELRDSYYNMKEKIQPYMFLISDAEKAMSDAGVTPHILPIRGGTDGARLSYMGLPCPNLSTGGMNFHGRHELIPVSSMEKMVEVIVNLAKK